MSSLNLRLTHSRWNYATIIRSELLPFLLSAACWTLLPVVGIAAEPGTGVHTLFLVRHGIYDSVKGAESKTANPLNVLGREQAELTADRLAAWPVKFDAVISSEFTRARETGDIIAARLGMKCQRDSLLNESLPPSPDLAKVNQKPVPGAEEQFNQAWARYAVPTPDASRSEILACHGNVIRWFVAKALGLDPNFWTRMVASNCSLTVIKISADGRADLLIYNDVSHLPFQKQTWEMDNKPLWPAPASK